MSRRKDSPQKKAWGTIRKRKTSEELHADYVKRGEKAHKIKCEAVRPLLIKWRRETFSQSEHCIVCGETMSNTFDEHHLDGNEKNRCSENVVVLCASCHRIINKAKLPEDAVRDFEQRHKRKSARFIVFLKSSHRTKF